MNNGWMLMVLDWIIGWGFDWFIEDGEWFLLVEKKNKRKEKLELWEVFRVSRVKWKEVYGDEFKDGEWVFKVRNGYGNWVSVEYSEKSLKEVLVKGIGGYCSVRGLR